MKESRGPMADQTGDGCLLLFAYGFLLLSPFEGGAGLALASLLGLVEASSYRATILASTTSPHVIAAVKSPPTSV